MYIIRTVWNTVRKTTNVILGVKGFKMNNSNWVGFHIITIIYEKSPKDNDFLNMQNAEIITFLLSVSPLRAISRSVWSVSMTMFSNIRGYNILKTDIHNKVLRCWEGIDGKMNGHAHYPR